MSTAKSANEAQDSPRNSPRLPPTLLRNEEGFRTRVSENLQGSTTGFPSPKKNISDFLQPVCCPLVEVEDERPGVLPPPGGDAEAGESLVAEDVAGPAAGV